MSVRIDILIVRIRLFRAHVLGCADHLALLRVQGLLRQGLVDGPGYSEVNHPGHDFFAFNGDEDI